MNRKDNLNRLPDFQKKESYLLTKTTYLKGMQCVKSLYLNKYFPQLRTLPDTKTRVLFKQGRDFEREFKLTFINGIDLKEKFGNDINSYISETTKILSENQDVVIFEAAIIYDDTLVLADVLKKHSDGSYSIYEVKLYTELKEVTKWDMSIQYYVCKSVLKNIREFNAVLRTSDGGYNIVNMIDELEKNLLFAQDNVEEFKSILQMESVPDIDMGQHCDYPYKCDFKGHCLNSKKISNKSAYQICVETLHKLGFTGEDGFLSRGVCYISITDDKIRLWYNVPGIDKEYIGPPLPSASELKKFLDENT